MTSPVKNLVDSSSLAVVTSARASLSAAEQLLEQAVAPQDRKAGQEGRKRARSDASDRSSPGLNLSSPRSHSRAAAAGDRGPGPDRIRAVSVRVNAWRDAAEIRTIPTAAELTCSYTSVTMTLRGV